MFEGVAGWWIQRNSVGRMNTSWKSLIVPVPMSFFHLGPLTAFDMFIFPFSGTVNCGALCTQVCCLCSPSLPQVNFTELPMHLKECLKKKNNHNAYKRSSLMSCYNCIVHWISLGVKNSEQCLVMNWMDKDE